MVDRLGSAYLRVVILFSGGTALLTVAGERSIAGALFLSKGAVMLTVIIALSIVTAALVIRNHRDWQAAETAGGIWLAGAIGVIAGSGYYLLTLISALIIYLLLMALNKMKV